MLANLLLYCEILFVLIMFLPSNNRFNQQTGHIHFVAIPGYVLINPYGLPLLLKNHLSDTDIYFTAIFAFILFVVTM